MTTITIDMERFRTALLTDKINHYWGAFTEDQWGDILAIAFEHFNDEDHDSNYNAYEVGYDVGHESGYEEGFEEGFENGKDSGYDDGFSNGYADGLYDARNEKPEDSV